jgi:hypothetical protein
MRRACAAHGKTAQLRKTYYEGLGAGERFANRQVGPRHLPRHGHRESRPRIPWCGGVEFPDSRAATDCR